MKGTYAAYRRSSQESMLHIEWLGTPNCSVRSLTGGKASRLSVLAADRNVPPGFCIGVDAYDMWRANSRQTALMPRRLSKLILDSYRELCGLCGMPSLPVAVRSSSILEDGSGLSFAGLYESILNVTGGEKVVEAVMKCWRSTLSDTVYSYLAGNRIAVQPGMAVLVQPFIHGDVAAVAFSVNPVTGNRQEIVINANWGLGTTIVAGSTTPDHYVVSKESLGILIKKVADKRNMSVPDGKDGVAEVEVPEERRRMVALEDYQIREVAVLAAELEAFSGAPVDIETTYRAGELFLLQCRPVTGLSN